MQNISEKSSQFLRLLEEGNLMTSRMFEEAIIVYGWTKSGKTTSSHILANSPLRSFEQRGDVLYRPATNRFPTAQIGNSCKSETEIPNIFQARFKVVQIKKIAIIDLPGYSDTMGIHGIVSRGYFNYRIFQKTPKLKFILLFSRTYLQATDHVFRETITNFIKTFAEYDEIKESILGATAFLITKVEHQDGLQRIRNIMERLHDDISHWQNGLSSRRFEEMIDHMLRNNKIYVIEKPPAPNIQTPESHLARQIYEATSFWQRNVSNNIADMSPITIDSSKEILTHVINRRNRRNMMFEEYNNLTQFIENQLRSVWILNQYCLRQIVEVLKNDCIGPIDSHSFIEEMRKFNQSQVALNSIHRNRLQEHIDKLFKRSQIQHHWEAYFMMKFEIVASLKDIALQLSQLQEYEESRALQFTQKILVFFIQIFKKIAQLQTIHSEATAILKYGYHIYNLVQIIKIIRLVIFNDAEINRQFQVNNIREIVCIARLFRDTIYYQFIDIDLVSMKIKFIKQLQLESLINYNQNMVNFFYDVTPIDHQIALKVAQIFIRFVKIGQKKVGIYRNKRYLAVVIFQFCVKLHKYYDSLLENERQSKKIKAITENIWRLTKSLGRLLIDLKLLESAREVFKSINNPSLIFDSYQIELEDGQKQRETYIRYGKSAEYYQRKQLALNCYQKAHAQCETMEDYEEVSQLIVSLQNAATHQSKYIRKLVNKQHFQAFSDNVRDAMSSICKQFQK